MALRESRRSHPSHRVCLLIFHQLLLVRFPAVVPGRVARTRRAAACAKTRRSRRHKPRSVPVGPIAPFTDVRWATARCVCRARWAHRWRRSNAAAFRLPYLVAPELAPLVRSTPRHALHHFALGCRATCSRHGAHQARSTATIRRAVSNATAVACALRHDPAVHYVISLRRDLVRLYTAWRLRGLGRIGGLCSQPGLRRSGEHCRAPCPG